MAITPEQRKKLDPVLDRLVAKVKELRDLHPGVWNTTEAPHPEDYVEDDPLRHPGNTEWVGMIREENDALDEVLLEILATQIRPAPADMVKITPDKLWVWGGPTPSWGGTMADDTLVRGADYFGAENVVYVYGPTNEKMMALHSKYTRMLCQVNSLCRTKGAQGELTEEENAEYLSELSLKYPNITGAMCDDVTVYFEDVVPAEGFIARYNALKKHNPALKMYGTVYSGECASKDMSLIEPYLDVITFWFWNKDSILEFDEEIAKCRETFPGKSILMGLFIHDYGRSDVENPIELLAYQLDKTREYMAKGIVEGVVILGDREIKKWPVTSKAVRDYLENQ